MSPGKSGQCHPCQPLLGNNEVRITPEDATGWKQLAEASPDGLNSAQIRHFPTQRETDQQPWVAISGPVPHDRHRVVLESRDDEVALAQDVDGKLSRSNLPAFIRIGAQYGRGLELEVNVSTLVPGKYSQRIFETEVVGGNLRERGFVVAVERTLNPIANELVVVEENQRPVAQSLNVELDELTLEGPRLLERFPGVLQGDIMSDAAPVRAYQGH